jgi:hypothetical protein
LNKSKTYRDQRSLYQAAYCVIFLGIGVQVGVNVFEQIVSSEPWTFTRMAHIVLLSFAILYLPMPWLVTRVILKDLSEKLAPEDSVSSSTELQGWIGKSMLSILLLSTLGTALIVMELERLLNH